MEGVTSAHIAEMLVPYDPIPLTEKVARRRRAVISRIVSLVITIGILVAVYFWQREQMRGMQVIVIYSIVLAIPLIWLIVVLIRYLLAKRQLRTLGYGTAIRIGPPGIQVAGLAAPWSQVARVAATKPGIGEPLQLRLTLVDGRWSAVDFEQVTIFPATLDSTVRAFSAGRHGVDLTAMDN
jgi:hypothetical protein